MPTSVPNFFAREILLVTLVSPKRQTLPQYNAAVPHLRASDGQHVRAIPLGDRSLLTLSIGGYRNRQLCEIPYDAHTVWRAITSR